MIYIKPLHPVTPYHSWYQVPNRIPFMSTNGKIAERYGDSVHLLEYDDVQDLFYITSYDFPVTEADNDSSVTGKPRCDYWAKDHKHKVQPGEVWELDEELYLVTMVYGDKVNYVRYRQHETPFQSISSDWNYKPFDTKDYNLLGTIKNPETQKFEKYQVGIK